MNRDNKRQKTRAQVKKTNYEIIPTPCPPPTPWHESTTPHLCHTPIIYNNNRIDTEFLVKIRQSNKCGHVRNDERFKLHLGSGEGPWVSTPCFLQDTSHIYWFHLPKQLNRKNQRTQKWDLTLNKLYDSALVYIHNPGLREVDLETSSKRGSDKIQALK